MKVIKENGKYYVNDLDLEEILANRKHLKSWINKQIAITEGLLERDVLNHDLSVTYKARLKLLNDIRREMNLRK